MPPDPPLTPDRILAAAEDVIRRFGPTKATVVDVARALGVTHAAVYRHFASKADLREAVVGRWVERMMPPLRAIAAAPGDPARRLRRFVDALVAGKRRLAADDPELFAAFRTLAAETRAVTQAHVSELADLAAAIVAVGVADGSFAPTADPATAGQAVLLATRAFHHPAHAAGWADSGIDAELEAVWTLVIGGLRHRPAGHES